ncbi:DUF1877 family protein [Arthrobacter sp. ZBG10]|uniref:DUF1877 family protein n=1 Tax=Arthrobacter sp. ZBG10 TaxID=1676590 RepID=UPI0006816A60|nr:DUF1877 family protein [Arthrobacter sp. ZBG10]
MVIKGIDGSAHEKYPTAGGVMLLSKLSGSLDDIGEHRSAAWFRQIGDGLQKGLHRKQEFEACRSILGPKLSTVGKYQRTKVGFGAQDRCMGIRYYAYAFDSNQTEKALADPFTVIGVDPLADAWGLQPGFQRGVTDFRQSLPERDFLNLDKAWPHLQRLTAPRFSGATARAAYRMFEGQVTYGDGGLSWRAWVRVLPPHDVALIARDLATVNERHMEALLMGTYPPGEELESEVAYATAYLNKAKDFVRAAASDGRGFAYTIR